MLKIYAIIINNKIYDILSLENNSPLPDGLELVDITNTKPKPTKGLAYDRTDNIFSLPYEETLTGKKDVIIKNSKQIASQKISAIFSDTEQRNSLYTLYKHNKKAKSAQTAEEKAEIADLENKWTQIETIRTASNQIEAEINTLTTIEEVQAYNIAGSPLWP